MKALLFDADGVVLNSEGFAKKFEADYPEISQKSIPFFREKFAACLCGKLDLVDTLSRELTAWGWPGDVQEFLKYWFEAEAHIDQELLAHIQEIRKKGYKCYLATNQETHRMNYILTTMHLGEAFDGVFASCTLGVMKDNEAFFHFVLDKLEGIEHKEILFWDDSAKNVETAKNAGIRGNVYTNYTGFKEQIKSLDGEL